MGLVGSGGGSGWAVLEQEVFYLGLPFWCVDFVEEGVG